MLTMTKAFINEFGEIYSWKVRFYAVVMQFPTSCVRTGKSCGVKWFIKT